MKWDESKNCWSLWIMRLLFPLIIIKNNGNNNASRMINDIMTSHQVTHFGNLLRTTPSSSPSPLPVLVPSPTSSMESRPDPASNTEMRRKNDSEIYWVEIRSASKQVSRFRWYVGNSMLCDWNIWTINEPSRVKMIQLIFKLNIDKPEQIINLLLVFFLLKSWFLIRIRSQSDCLIRKCLLQKIVGLRDCGTRAGI